ncbi:DUF1211 domain-containing protein [Methanoculleus sp. FWC-SCC1]|uniref:DUF1211 domain-containing protein n=1 Tax=Methanoculleus frigidifontis TaxID=2584085 RepID=A0ABT8MB76_9EURY|nr:TMEM175 family protein [Methanoculleus sp. FWC-SCC1]MDN7025176.1 DUF1211 domain-containing protein [Methanoculleus sp. FWC-SCC1]
MPSQNRSGEAEKRCEQIGFAKNRLEALTDGIFAVAMTLIVVGMFPEALQTASAGSAAAIVARAVPDVYHYVVAFLILAGFWIGHHMQTRYLRAIDRPFLQINIFILMSVALVPFTSSIAGDFPYDPLAAVLFEGNVLVVGLLLVLAGRYIRTHPCLLSDRSDPEALTVGWMRGLVIPGLSAVGILLALAGVPWTTTIYIAAPILLRIIGTRD